jgi:DMSO/TMAO reductase YedYZ molybdopterin-dependent catalytic subunit
MTMERQPENTLITMQLGLALLFLLSLMFISGGLFYLYSFNYDIGPYFTVTRAIHFYAGLASIPFLLAKYGSTSLRFAGYYLRVPRFQERGPPRLIPRILSPLLAVDFFVLYFSGLYMLFHYYYSVINVPPLDFKPVQLHVWASIVAVPLVAAHLGSHLVETIRELSSRRQAPEGRQPATRPAAGMTRRAFLGTVLAGGAGLAVGFQNTGLVNTETRGLFIGRIPAEERGGPGAFPVETLFGKARVDSANWRLNIGGQVGDEVSLTYDEILKLPAHTYKIRLSCVSGWTAVPTWSGPRVRDVLALARPDAGAKSVNFHSLSDYAFTWHMGPLIGEKALIATHVNGAPLSENHGFPVRLILPGYPGQNMVKQLDVITVRTDRHPFDPDFKLT